MLRSWQYSHFFFLTLNRKIQILMTVQYSVQFTRTILSTKYWCAIFFRRRAVRRDNSQKIYEFILFIVRTMNMMQRNMVETRWFTEHHWWLSHVIVCVCYMKTKHLYLLFFDFFFFGTYSTVTHKAYYVRSQSSTDFLLCVTQCVCMWWLNDQ